MDTDSISLVTAEYPSVLPRLDAEQLRALRTISELKEGPIPAVLDTSCVRTGLQYQLVNDRLPASMGIVRSGQFRIFMELDTLHETWNRLPRFAEQLNVPLAKLQRMFADDWLPLLSIVSLPEGVRQIDRRAAAVRKLDSDDYPTAALAALLSPCILLTHNHRDFGPLDVKITSQGVDAVFAAINVKVGETHVQAVVMLPATPVVAVGAITKWAAEKIGPMAWFVLALLVVGGVVMYRRQPSERKEQIKNFASESGKFLLDEYGRAISAVQQAEDQLVACVVPGPEDRSITSAVFRKLAMTGDSMSAQQICEALDDSVRPAVDPLRRFLHGNKTTVFREVRRGGFILGGRYHVAQPIQA
jgi:hypothetical protein